MFPYEDSKILSVCPYPEKRNHPSFVNISPTVVNDTSMERSSCVVHYRNPKIRFSFQKKSKSNFDLCRRAEITLFSLANMSPTVVIDSSMERSSIEATSLPAPVK